MVASACDPSPDCLPSTTFQEIASLIEADKYGMDGMHYDTSFPFPPLPPHSLAGKTIGFLVSHCYEEVELTLPFTFFQRLGAEVKILAPGWVTDGMVGSCDFARARTWTKRDMDFHEAM